MTQQELKQICDSQYNKIVENKFSQEQFSKKLYKFSDDGKTISDAGKVMFVITETQEFAKTLLYNVLCEVLDVKR